jgi:SRSO17 transposase
MKTYTPGLSPSVLGRLADYAASFAPALPPPRPALGAPVYPQGLLLDGQRTSIEPSPRRVTLPGGRAVKDPEQPLPQFVNQSPWDQRTPLKHYRATLADTCASPEGVFLFDDVSGPRQGRHAVGVRRRYGGALGTRADCQVAVGVHYVSPEATTRPTCACTGPMAGSTTRRGWTGPASPGTSAAP